MTSTSPASRSSHTSSLMESIVARQSGAPSADSSANDSARATSEGQIVFGKSRELNRRLACWSKISRWSSAKAMLAFGEFFGGVGEAVVIQLLSPCYTWLLVFSLAASQLVCSQRILQD